MSTPQQAVSGPTRGNEARSMIMQGVQQNEADAKIAAETARREAREDAIRAEERSYYETKEAKQRAEDDARYASQNTSYQSAYANQSLAAVNPQGSGSFNPTPSSPVNNSTFQPYQKPSGDRDSWTTAQTRDWKAHRGVTAKYS